MGLMVLKKNVIFLFGLMVLKKMATPIAWMVLFILPTVLFKMCAKMRAFCAIPAL